MEAGIYLVKRHPMAYFRVQLVEVVPKSGAIERWHFRAWRQGTSKDWGPWASGDRERSKDTSWIRLNNENLINFYKAIL